MFLFARKYLLEFGVLIGSGIVWLLQGPRIFVSTERFNISHVW